MAKIQDIRNRTPFSNHRRSLSQIKHIVRHHSATNSGDFDSFWRYWHGTRGWGTGGYHEIILRDGTVQLCYDAEQVTNGVANYNTPCYHICLVGNGSFTPEQEKAWDERVAYNMNRLNIEVDEVKGHKEMPNSNTACPGIDMDLVRSRIKLPSNDIHVVQSGDSLWSIAKKYDTTVAVLKQLNDLKSDLIHPGDKIKLPGYRKSEPTKHKADLKVDGYWGAETTKALQRHFSTPVDGVISDPSMLIKAMQRWLGTPVDGIISEPSMMVRALQKRLGTPVDGVISEPSMMVKELQRRLNKGNL